VSEDRELRREVAEFYQRVGTARGYFSQRYSGAAGAYVVRRELAIVSSLLPPKGRVLDVACGTGRLGTVLGSSHALVGVDASEAMLEQARAGGRYEQLVVGDAFALPFADDSFDAAVALRLLFHFPEPISILRELSRVTRPGGVVVVETAGWSPRAGTAWDSARWGPRVFVHKADMIHNRLTASGLHLTQSVDAFLFSPYLYRRLPPFGVFLLERLESSLPTSLRCRTFWQAEVVGEPGAGTPHGGSAGAG
jgi:SAM-dependent methyltransferase